MTLVTDFPLFPLQLVVLPSEVVPLHIFEERYKTMIGECLSGDREFGIVWLADDGLHEIGCACRVEQVLETLEDGRMNLLTRGTGPFRIVERQSHLPYPAGIVEFLTDAEETVDAELRSRVQATYADLVRKATDKQPDANQLARMSAYEMAATVDFGLDAKQALLDMRSEGSRLSLVMRLFRAALKRLDFVDRAQTRAKSNGKVRFG